jgi:hypothetical protein
MADIYVYGPLPEQDERYPAWQRFSLPNNSDKLAEKIGARGWQITPPAGVAIFDEKGNQIQVGPAKPAARKGE